MCVLFWLLLVVSFARPSSPPIGACNDQDKVQIRRASNIEKYNHTNLHMLLPLPIDTYYDLYK